MTTVEAGPSAGRSHTGTGPVRLAAVALVAALALIGCGRGGDGGQPAGPPPQQPGPTQSTLSSSAPAVTPPATATPALADGQHFAYIASVEVGSSDTVTLDLIEFLTGADANKACVAHKAPECPPPNDYFIVNDNPKLRTMPVSATVTVKVLASLGSTDQVSISFEAIPTHFSGVATAKQLSPLPFKLTVSNGMVVALAEIFLP